MGLTSLRFRLLLLVLVAVLPGIALLLVAAREGEGRVEAGQRDEAQRLANLLSQEQQRTIESAQALLTGTSRMAALAAPIDPARCHAALAAIRDEIPTFNNLAVVDASGDLICAAAPLERPISIAHRAHFQRAVASRTFATGEFVVARINGRSTYYFATPVFGADRRLEVVVTVGLDLPTLQRRLEAQSLPAGAAAVVTDAGGRVLARRPPPVRSGDPYDLPLWDRMRGGDSGQAEQRDPDGVTRLYAFHPVPAPGGQPAMLVAVGLPVGPGQAQVRAVLWRMLAGFGAVGVLAIVVALAMGESLLARPLDRVISAARRLSAGDLSARTGLGCGRGEIGELAGAFDELARSLEQDAAERHRLEEQLRQAQKMEAVGQLAGGIAHDFNNLLTAILSFGGFVKNDLGEGHPSRPDVDEILASAARAAALTRQLLAFSRRQVLEVRVLDLGEAVRGVENMLRRLIGENIALETRVVPGATVLADPGHVEQILLNLAVNARDAMPAGGRLLLEVAEVPPDAPEVRADGGLPSGPLVRLSVRDTGTGMDPETLAHAFEPFFTTKPIGQGTGLGLSTVYGIVTQSGGVVRVESAPGQGATFRIYLPRADGAGGTRAAVPPAGVRLTGSETVLLVEDDDAVRALSRRVLTQAGYRVLQASRPSEARELAEQGGRIHLLLTDVMLPETSGPELARELTALSPDLKVLYTSGYTAGHLALEDLVNPGRAFLPKPFGPVQLLQRTREVLDAPLHGPERARKTETVVGPS